MTVVNLTPHSITLFSRDGLSATLPSAGSARCAVHREVIGTVTVDGLEVPLCRTTFGAVEGLPDQQPGVLYVCSALAAQAARAAGRMDVVTVDDVVRDEGGRVLGARALAIP